jgi:hypothetical protein
MGTRGSITVYYNGKKFCLYNHFDSYPDGLGYDLVIEILQLLDSFSQAEIIAKLNNIKIVNNSIQPTEEDIIKLKAVTDLTVSNQSTNDWYCLLRNTQGSILSVLEVGYVYDGGSGEEFDYHVDFDNMKFWCNDMDKYDMSNIKSFIEKVGPFVGMQTPIIMPKKYIEN